MSQADQNPLGKRTAVYRLSDASGALLYVGITGDLERRWEWHAKEKFWWHLVARKEVIWYATRREAEEAEKSDIQANSPIYNRTWNKNKVYVRAGDPPPPDPFREPLTAALRDAIQTGQYPPGHVFRDDLETAASLGTSYTTLGWALASLTREGLLSRGPITSKMRKRARIYTVLTSSKAAEQQEGGAGS